MVNAVRVMKGGRPSGLGARTPLTPQKLTCLQSKGPGSGSPRLRPNITEFKTNIVLGMVATLQFAVDTKTK